MHWLRPGFFGGRLPWLRAKTLHACPGLPTFTLVMRPSSLRDARSFMRKATPRRVANGLQVVASYVVSRLTGRARAWGLPVAMSFEPTTSCNLR